MLAVLLVIGAFALDDRVDARVRDHNDPQWRIVAYWISNYANLPSAILVSLVLWLAGLRWKRSDWRKLAVALTVSACLAGVIVTSIRSVTGRTRPSAKAPQGWYGLRHDSQWLIGRSSFNSFPSGHTGTAAGFAGALLVAARRWTLPAVFYIVIMGWSRIYQGAHHLSDVTAAAMIGIAVGYFTWHRLMPRLLKTRFAQAMSVNDG